MPLYLDELIFVADKLSHGRQKWTYNKRRKANIRDAIKANSSYDEVVETFRENLGKEINEGSYFPRVLQIEKIVIGPLGLLSSIESRSRYEADTIFNIFEGHIRSKELLQNIINFISEIPADIQGKSHKISNDKAASVQLVLTYFSDKRICCFINKLVEERKIKLEITGLYENVENHWLVTKYGIALVPEEEAVKNLADLIKQNYSEEELLPELKTYSGGFQTKLLEYCITDNPQVILKKLFALPDLRRIAKKMGFATSQIDNAEVASAIVLIGLGFNVPPELTGISSSMHIIERLHKEFFETQKIERKSGIMSQTFVELVKVIRDLSYFYIGCLWADSLKTIQENIEQEMPQLFPRQQKLLSLNRFVRRKFKVEKPFEKSGLGDYISLVKSINHRVCGKPLLISKLSKKVNRDYLITNQTKNLG